MKLGICCGPEVARDYLLAGFDYVEMPAQLLKGRDAVFDIAGSTLEGWETSNLFFPGDMHLYADESWREYAQRLVQRAGLVGLSVMVVGSGAARRASDIMGPQEGLRSFLMIVGQIQEMARPLGITIAPEALRSEETNVGNSTPEMAFALKGISGWTLDLFHAYVEGTRASGPPLDWEAFWTTQIPHAPDHVHGSAMDRSAPTFPDPALQAAFSRLRSLGYDGRVSLECRVGDRPAAEVCTTVRRYLEL